MDSFLHQIAQHLWNRHHGHMDEVLVVFNNRRAGRFLTEELIGMDSRPFFLPRIIGIDDLINELGMLQIAPQELMLFELYDIHCQKEGPDRRFQTFEEFMSFGMMMLGDFSEIDLYMVDARSLFNTLKEHKRLGEWEPDVGDSLTPFQEKYLAFFNSLYDYYSQLRQTLTLQGRAYMGMAYRHVAENIATLAPNIHEKQVYFVGFNALSTSEKAIIKHFIDEGQGHLLVDGDDYYFNDEHQEAGLFLRKHAKTFAGIGPFEAHFAEKKKHIHIVNCPENVLQTVKAGHLLESIIETAEKEETTNGPKSPETALEKTAVVLADEHLLLPMLNALPEKVDKANVTMGYPYTYSETHKLASAILSLYNHSSKNGRFHHNDLTTICSCQIFSKALGCSDLHSQITKTLNDGKIIYLSPDEARELMSGILHDDRANHLFQSSAPTIMEVFDILRQTASILVNNNALEDNTKEQESLACLMQIVDYFRKLQTEHQFIGSISTLQKVYDRMAQRRSISFIGQPVTGLQLLGVLETRSLDFDRIIMLSVNEGILPSGKNDNSLIPYALKKNEAYQLPTFKEKEAVYSYHFYRMLQRTDEAWLLYSSESGGMGKGEPSRFIMQLKNELALRYPNIVIDEETVSTVQRQPTIPTVRTAPKGPDILQRLHDMAATGFSPSALNRYRSCPMLFFLQDVMGAREQETVSEDLESNELGTFIHDCLCEIYNLDTDRQIREQTLRTALDQLDAVTDEKYKSNALKKRSSEGKNHLYLEVAKTQIRRFLEKEIQYLEKGHTIHIEMTEHEMAIPLVLNDFGINETVTIKGTADRIDTVEGHLRVADYKSGAVDKKELHVDGEGVDFRDVSDKWFQVMTYAWLFCRSFHYEKPFSSGIFPLQQLRADFLPASWNGKLLLDHSDIDKFELMLKSLLSEMLDPNTPFVAKPKSANKSCAYCPFTRSCHPDKSKTPKRTKKNARKS